MLGVGDLGVGDWGLGVRERKEERVYEVRLLLY